MTQHDPVRHSPLATPTATRSVLERHDISLKKSLGQNFLINDDVIGKILRLSGVNDSDFVLEVGPGIGTLTYALLETVKAVISIERDKELPSVLEDTLSAHRERFYLVSKDALDVQVIDLNNAADALGLDSLPNKLVANLPYSVAATIVLDYFERFSSIESMTVMVQREVAERMMAKPKTKNYGAYTVKLSLFAKYAGSFSVGPGNFMPPPHVESTVIKLERRSDLAESKELIKASCMMADAAFTARRKTISNSCRQYFSGRDKKIADSVNEILECAHIDPGVRGEALTTQQFLDLGKAFIDFCHVR